MNITYVEYPKCTTCKRGKKWLEEHNFSFQERNIKEKNPTVEELKHWHQLSKLPLKRFFNTSGMVYRELDLKNKLFNMSEEEQFTLLASDGMLVKRPIIVTDTTVLVGMKEKEWEEALL
ncbi:MAG: arsenate reductase family protein [Lachnospiraceae bacterium]|nr:arsenate reductase family protein [Lachnospiraceae bacterium]